jgi:chromosome segregation ATPase
MNTSKMSPSELREHELRQRIAELEAENKQLKREINTLESAHKETHRCYMILDDAHNQRRSERDKARYWAREYKRRLNALQCQFQAVRQIAIKRDNHDRPGVT